MYKIYLDMFCCRHTTCIWRDIKIVEEKKVKCGKYTLWIFSYSKDSWNKALYLEVLYLLDRFGSSS